MKFIVLFTLVLFLSCRDNSRIVILDEYFANIHKVDYKDNEINLVITSINDFNIDNYSYFKTLVISPLIYFSNLEIFSSIENEILVLNDYINGGHNNISFIQNNMKIAYNELVQELDKDVNSLNISILIDYENESKKNDVNILRNLEQKHHVDFLFLDDKIGRNTISKFIETNEDNDLWIIDSNLYGLYIYELLDEKRIILVEGDSFSTINDNVIYSINSNMNDSIDDIVHNKTNFIEFKLIKH